MNTEAQLLPCPFCGAAPTLQHCNPDEIKYSYGGYYVECKCGVNRGLYTNKYNADCGEYTSEQEAIAAWNTRAKAALTEETADALRCVLGIVRHVGLAGGLSYPPQAQAKAVAHLESLLPIAVERK